MKLKEANFSIILSEDELYDIAQLLWCAEDALGDAENSWNKAYSSTNARDLRLQLLNLIPNRRDL